MAQSIWEKIGLVPQLQPEVFGPQYAMQGPLSNEALGLVKPKPKEEVTPKTLQKLVGRAPQSAPEPQGEELMETPLGGTNPFQELLNKRLSGMTATEAEIENLKANPTKKTFQTTDLSPLLAWADGLGQSSISKGYNAPKVVGDAEKIQALKDALGKDQAGVSDDLLQLQSQEDAQKRFNMEQTHKEKLLGLEREKMANALQIAGLKKSGAGGSGKTTDAQNMAATYGKRMEDAEGIIGGLVNSGVDLTTFASIAEKNDYLPNNIKDPNIRQLLQAQRNFINATLRKESGASIAPTEFKSAIAQYFPQWGDDPQTLQQKAFNRARAIEGMRIQAGDDLWGRFSEDPTKLLGKSAPPTATQTDMSSKKARYEELMRKAGKM